jgi:NAD(P)-dependent dehydrogenase (short-subunit alcohol dehydrogenase family)
MMSNPFDFSGQVALLCGTAGALGRPIAAALAEAGATLALADLDEAGLGILADELRPHEGAISQHMVDLRSAESVDGLVESVIEQHGRIDILVNTAGINSRSPAAEFPQEVWDRVMELDLRGTWLISQAVGTTMVQRKKGRIVNFASGAAYNGAPGYAAYSPAKAGVVSLTRVLASEWAVHGVGVNAIAPGHTDSPMAAGLLSDPDVLASIKKRSPIGDILPPSAQVGPTLFLCSPAAQWVNGVTIRVDGGWHVT